MQVLSKVFRLAYQNKNWLLISACSQICILLQFLGSVDFIFWIHWSVSLLHQLEQASFPQLLIGCVIWAPDHLTALWSLWIFLIILLQKRVPTSGPCIAGAACGRMWFGFWTEVLPATRDVSHSFQCSSSFWPLGYFYFLWATSWTSIHCVLPWACRDSQFSASQMVHLSYSFFCSDKWEMRKMVQKAFIDVFEEAVLHGLFSSSGYWPVASHI